MLKENNLYSMAFAKTPGDGAVGGIKDEHTKEHFATRFPTSSARIQAVLLDPWSELGAASDVLLTSFSGGRIGLLDIPCGACASSISLLATLAALRESGVVPRQPLYVWILSADISDLARSYASILMDKVRDSLEKQGIHVHQRFESWDVQDSLSNTALIDAWIRWIDDCDERFVLVTNFSDFLGDDTRFKRAEERLGEVFRWASMRQAKVLWVEPQTTKASRFLDKLISWFQNKVPRLIRKDISTHADGALQTKVNYMHPITKLGTTRVRSSVIRLEVGEN
ncbi:MAG: hypothetical protein KF886_20075 [Candidatus Hydrogenedentes bacterium]|nr:hypothetical protein [Candidatus Hydrogenedentota bacterium]